MPFPSSKEDEFELVNIQG